MYGWLRDEWLEVADLAFDTLAVDGDNDAWGASRWGLLHVDTEGATLIGGPRDPTGQVAPLTLDASAAGSPHVLSVPDVAPSTRCFGTTEALGSRPRCLPRSTSSSLATG